MRLLWLTAVVVAASLACCAYGTETPIQTLDKVDVEVSDGMDLLGTLASPNKELKMLNSSNFEHDTQASSGMTTGDWFVMFYADFCGHCHRVKPEMEALAKRYNEHSTSIAMVDGEASGDLRRRFNVRSFPSFILFRNKKMYRYNDHHHRNSDSFVKFLTAADPGVEGEDIPHPMTLTDEFLFLVNSVELNDLIQLYDENPTLFMVTVGSVLISNVLLLVTCLVPLFKKSPPKAVGATPAHPKIAAVVERKQK